jgi:hypothetical protein
MRRRAFSGPPEPFDWPLFFKTFPFQPVVFWLILGALARPFAAAVPALTGAACQGRLRLALSQIAIVFYTMLVPPLLTIAYYLLFARRRLPNPHHRRVADGTFGLILILSFADGAALASKLHDQWATLRPGYKAVRAACWPMSAAPAPETPHAPEK